MAVATQGIAIATEATPGSGTFDQPIGEVVSFDGPTANKPEIETTHLQSTAKEYIPGLRDDGTITFAMNFTDPEDAGQALLRANFEATNPTDLNFEITIGARVYSFSGFVQEYPISAATDSKVDQNATLRVNGGGTWTTV